MERLLLLYLLTAHHLSEVRAELRIDHSRRQRQTLRQRIAQREAADKGLMVMLALLVARQIDGFVAPGRCKVAVLLGLPVLLGQRPSHFHPVAAVLCPHPVHRI